MTTISTPARRPLKTRGAKTAQNIAIWLSKQNITPNQISVSSVFFALLAGTCFFMIPYTAKFTDWALPILAAVFIQCRLLCNLFDGMVAIEGGKSTKSGELFNDIPDRFADALILIGAGYAVSFVWWGPVMGWLAALLAVMTAYVRTLSASMGAPMDFRGPMAKQHRMFVMTLAAFICPIEAYFSDTCYGILSALVLINIGCVITLIRRISATYCYLERS